MRKKREIAADSVLVEMRCHEGRYKVSIGTQLIEMSLTEAIFNCLEPLADCLLKNIEQCGCESCLEFKPLAERIKAVFYQEKATAEALAATEGAPDAATKH